VNTLHPPAARHFDEGRRHAVPPGVGSRES
jgi:hypothetical protein